MKTLQHLCKGWKAMPITHGRKNKKVIVIDTVSP